MCSSRSALSDQISRSGWPDWQHCCRSCRSCRLRTCNALRGLPLLPLGKGSTLQLRQFELGLSERHLLAIDLFRQGHASGLDDGVRLQQADGIEASPMTGMDHVETVANVRDLDPRVARQSMTVVGERVIYELRGISYISLETVPAAQGGAKGLRRHAYVLVEGGEPARHGAGHRRPCDAARREAAPAGARRRRRQPLADRSSGRCCKSSQARHDGGLRQARPRATQRHGTCRLG